MSFSRRVILLAMTSLLTVAASACGLNPQNPGDVCDPEAGCPNDLVCAPDGDTNVCYVDLNGTCEAAGDKDYCLDESTCSGGKCQIPVGGACDPKGEDACIDDMVCGENLDGTGKCGIPEGGACDPNDPQCAGAMVCAELTSGGNACYPPVLIVGMVFDSATTEGVEKGHVIAIDDQGTAITDIAITDAEGNYMLDLPIQRDDTGAPIQDVIFTLRGSASGYQTFPGGLRTALPIASSEAVDGELAWTIDTTLTDIALISLPADQQGLASISGTVVADQGKAGVLVVAEDGVGPGISAVTDKSGGYTIFNVPDGTYKVRGFAAGLQLTPADATVAGEALEGVDLTASTDALGTITGSVAIVDGNGFSATSVVLVVKSTFNDTFARGEVPRGLRTPLTGPPNISGAFTIVDVPAGEYVVLAGFENDGLVRDPDPNIAGTQIVTVQMPAPGMDVPLSDSFKITGALTLLGPGVDEPEPVTEAPTLRWVDDASEEFYTVVVYNAYGELVWCLSDQLGMACDGPNIPAMSGVTEVAIPYGGPMEPGMYYQFRATSWRIPGGQPGPISQTEDLRGVFYVDVKP
jgi:hypothetical protein